MSRRLRIIWIELDFATIFAAFAAIFITRYTSPIQQEIIDEKSNQTTTDSWDHGENKFSLSILVRDQKETIHALQKEVERLSENGDSFLEKLRKAEAREFETKSQLDARSKSVKDLQNAIQIQTSVLTQKTKELEDKYKEDAETHTANTPILDDEILSVATSPMATQEELVSEKKKRKKKKKKQPSCPANVSEADTIFSPGG